MTINLGTVPADETIYIPFTTYGGTNGESITCTGLAVTDIEIYKNGSVTQRSSDVGFALLDTDGIDFDGLTGLHGFSVDLSDNTDAGFYAVGGFYWVIVSAITVDSQTVTFCAAVFRIGLAEVVTGVAPVDVQYVDGDAPAAANLNSACDNYSATRGLTGTALPAVAADGAGGLPVSDAGGLDLDTKLANTNEVTAARMATLTDWINGGRLDLLLDAIPTTAMRGTDSAALASVCTEARLQALTDWLNGGRLDLLLDAIPTTAMRGTDSAALASVCTEARLAELAAANLPADVDTLLTRLTAVRAAVLTDWINGGRLDLLLDAIPTTAMRGTDSAALASVCTEARLAALTDWINGGRLDLLLDAIKAVTDALTAAAATKLALSAGTIITGTVSHDNTVATTTVIYSDDITEATADHYNGRIMLFTSGALVGQATDITDYALDTGEGKFTVTALTEAPADNVTFIIV